MKMLATIAVVLLPLAASAAHAAGPARAQNQRQRIARGVADGSLTRGEATALHREQQAIRGLRRGALADDGRVGPAEARRLEGARNRASGDIYRLRHNDQER
jgi:hypothetical protein